MEVLAPDVILVRVHDRHFGKWALFFVLAVAALVVNLAYHVL